MDANQLPAWRQGWTWALIKCAALVALATLLGAGVLYYLAHAISPPWWVPPPLWGWLHRHLVHWAAWLGGFLGALGGLAGSVGIVMWDAKKGRLTRLR